MEDESYSREASTLCICNRGVYAKMPVAVRTASNQFAELQGVFIGLCMYCGTKSMFEQGDRKVWRYQVPSQSFWDRVTELLKQQWPVISGEVEVKAAAVKRGPAPCQEDQKLWRS